MTTPPTATDWPRLDQQICFSLNAASRAFGSVYRVILKDSGDHAIRSTSCCWCCGSTATPPVKKLGEHLRLDSGTLSPLLKRLETAGLVRRERSTHDERSVVVRLTEDGVALRERAVQVPRRIVSATSFDVDEIRGLRARLDELTSALDAAVHAELPDGD